MEYKEWYGYIYRELASNVGLVASIWRYMPTPLSSEGAIEATLLVGVALVAVVAAEPEPELVPEVPVDCCECPCVIVFCEFTRPRAPRGRGLVAAFAAARVLASQGGRVLATAFEDVVACSSEDGTLVVPFREEGCNEEWVLCAPCLRLEGRAAALAGESSAMSLVPNLALALDSLPYAPTPNFPPDGVVRRPPRAVVVLLVVL